MDCKYFYLNTMLAQAEYIRIPLKMIPQRFYDKYKLQDKISNKEIYAEVTGGMYGLPQAGRIANDELIKNLEQYGYVPIPRTAGLWKHKTNGLDFTLVSDDFGVTYESREDADKLKEVLEKKYKVTTDWEGKLYVVITLDWDYDQHRVKLIMPGYGKALMHQFQHPKPTRTQYASFPTTMPVYGKEIHIIKPTVKIPLLSEYKQTTLFQVVRVCLYYALAVDNTILPELN